MHLQHLKNLSVSQDSYKKVLAITWSANNEKFAVAKADLIVYLYDEQGEKRDKFKTKPGNSGSRETYLIHGLEFSPDSTKLAVAQSDNTIFIYKLGSDWEKKKSICNKFFVPNSPLCLHWPLSSPDDVVSGLVDGKVCRGNLKSNRICILSQHPLKIPAILIKSVLFDDKIAIAIFADGSMWKVGIGEIDSNLFFQIGTYGQQTTAAAIGRSILLVGAHRKASFFDLEGQNITEFDFSKKEGNYNFYKAEFNPGGDCAALGGYDKFIIFTLDARANMWQQTCEINIKNYYNIWCLSWKPDGSKLVISNCLGSMDIYDIWLKKTLYNKKFKFTYVSKNSVIVKMLCSGACIVLRSLFSQEIMNIKIYQERFLVARTSETLLLGDLESCKLSEILWNNNTDETEKFYFENEKACIMYCYGEMYIVEYGRKNMLGSFQTNSTSPFLTSLVIETLKLHKHCSIVSQDTTPDSEIEMKTLAYMMDPQTIQIMDLVKGIPLVTISHSSKVDWLELNVRSTHLLYRDKCHSLHLYVISDQSRIMLLDHCQYVQWVPRSDVIVAQNESCLYVWYSARRPDARTVYKISGTVEDIERQNNKTEVLVNDGGNQMGYTLDESLIDFESSLEDLDFVRALNVLEPLPCTPDIQSQWQQLAEASLAHGHITIARRSFVACGNIARALYLHKLELLAKKISLETKSNGYQSCEVQCRLAMLGKRWSVAEALLLSQKGPNAAIDMYIEVHKWEEAIRVAEYHKSERTEEIKENYFNWLLATGQEAEAGVIKEKAGSYTAAISYYLKAGLPARASQVAINNDDTCYDPLLLESIIESLMRNELYEQLGDLLKHLNRAKEAKENYQRGQCYRKLVDLCREKFSEEVVRYEEEWGDWLVSQKQSDSAVNHYIQAGKSLKAAKAALQARQLEKAASILELLEREEACPYFKNLAVHYHSISDFKLAEKYYIKSGNPIDAVNLYMSVGQWEEGHKVAMGHLKDEEIHSYYVKFAREMEAERKFKEAEKAYLLVDEADSAIKMYKNQKEFREMVRLVKLHKNESTKEQCLYAARVLEKEGRIKEAEKYYLEAGEWKNVIHLHKTTGNLEEALRIATSHGGTEALAYDWALNKNKEKGVQQLKKLGLLDHAIDYAIDTGSFSNAFSFATLYPESKTQEIHLKYAMYLEDEGHFKEAEEEFINVGKPREAIEMYMHNKDWDAAMKVAERYDPTSVPNIYCEQADKAMAQGKFSLAESLYICAKHPELALKMYKDNRMLEDALRVAENYIPSKIQEVHLEFAAEIDELPDIDLGSSNDQSGLKYIEKVLAKARAFEKGHDFGRAIEAYLSLGIEDCPNYDILQKLWESAVNICMSHQKHRLNSVVDIATQRLIQIERYEAAAGIYEGIDDIEGAVKCYCLAGNFEKARGLSKGVAVLTRYIEEAYDRYLVINNNADELARRGQADQALEMYAEMGEWDKLHGLASTQSEGLHVHYSLKHAAILVRQNNCEKAASVLATHGLSPEDKYMSLYECIARKVLALNKSQSSSQCHERHLRKMLINLLEMDVSEEFYLKFLKFFKAAHLLTMLDQSLKSNMTEFAYKQSLSLLRYASVIPPDKAFYLAGICCKAAGRLNSAYVILNKYLDLVEAMEDEDGNILLENDEFSDTDICFDFDLATEHYVEEADREAVRDWVLTVSMDTQTGHKLIKCLCEKCHSLTYEANLVCHKCKAKYDTCVITGYPVSFDKRYVDKDDNRIIANLADWQCWTEKFGSDIFGTNNRRK